MSVVLKCLQQRPYFVSFPQLFLYDKCTTDSAEWHFWHSSYLLDATRPNRLWFDEFGKRNWLNLNGLLSQAVEELAA